MSDYTWRSSTGSRKKRCVQKSVALAIFTLLCHITKLLHQSCTTRWVLLHFLYLRPFPVDLTHHIP